MDLVPLLLSFKLAVFTTVMLVVIAAPVAYLLVYFRFPGKSFVDAFIALPIVLPPTVLGFYLLIWLGPGGAIGHLWEVLFGLPLLFTFSAIVIASLVYNLPFAVQPMKASFEKIDTRLMESAYILGLSRVATFFRVILPNALGGIIASAILVFVHTMGEFGVILMVGGSIPGKTRVASIAIYEAVEALRYRDAMLMSLALIPVSYVFLLLINRLNLR
ncbi:MAG TPA: molybdate ABC transporter permease subunit [Deltaproteobacteria bacterium]|nr:molybdate ABC transporter permease subunit [Deltaproteobacteria bacterium]HPJ94415.1 molybdate ABC transporter permease subunit [Deltaproteobacteria bacterium]HPR50226.1 molybdate ABC transporter permease subunit [Deltaproteobacteria bacterium]